MGWGRLGEADARTFRRIEEQARISAPMYLAWYPGDTADWILDDMLCRFEQLSSIERGAHIWFSFACRLKRWAGAASAWRPARALDPVVVGVEEGDSGPLERQTQQQQRRRLRGVLILLESPDGLVADQALARQVFLLPAQDASGGAALFRRDDPHARLHVAPPRSEEHTSELQSIMRTSYAVFCLK